MLTVAAKSTGARLVKEKSVEDYIGTLLTSMGKMNWHTADKWQKGRPDRYVVGGNHIEFKSVVCTKRVEIIRFFKPEQIIMLDQIVSRSTDRAFACVRVCVPKQYGDDRLIFEPWENFTVFARRSLKIEEIMKRFAPYDNAVAVLKRWFT